MRKNCRQAQKGFTLIEILLVVSIIAAICLFAVPRMLEARYGALESSAATYLRSLHQSEVQFQTREGHWGTLDELRAKGYLKQEIAAYSLDVVPSADGGGYQAIATPIPRPTEMRHFFVDTSGVIRERTGGAADASSTPAGG